MGARWTQNEEPLAVVADAIGQGVDLHFYRSRGIVSVVQVDTYSGQPMSASAEVELEALVEAVAKLTVDADLEANYSDLPPSGSTSGV